MRKASSIARLSNASCPGRRDTASLLAARNSADETSEAERGCRPTRYVGGDFYDFHLMPTGDLIAVWPTFGKGHCGICAQFEILGCLQLRLQDGEAPAAALNRLNTFIHSKGQENSRHVPVLPTPDGRGRTSARPIRLRLSGSGRFD